jgi:hypothetical protein
VDGASARIHSASERGSRASPAARRLPARRSFRVATYEHDETTGAQTVGLQPLKMGGGSSIGCGAMLPAEAFNALLSLRAVSFDVGLGLLPPLLMRTCC